MMERCTKCHLAIIPDEVLDIWEKKFGKREKPNYWVECKLCGVPAGKHYGTDCPDERVKKLAGMCEEFEAQRDALLEACKKTRDWLDGCSLHQILVHNCDDKKTADALIMGIANNLIRLEDAIDKYQPSNAEAVGTANNIGR